MALSGGGTIQLSDSGTNEIYSNTGSTTLDNIDNTIQGAGSIFNNGNLAVTNEAKGVIDGTSAVNVLRITSIGLTNKGLVEASGAGGLKIDGMTLDDSAGGVLEANGGAVTIGGGATIVGGTLQTVGAGTFQVNGANSVLDGTTAAVTIASATTLQIDNNVNLYLNSNGTTGSIVNKGKIFIDAAGNYTDLIVGRNATGGTVALSGGGVVQLSDSSLNEIYSNTGSTLLDNIGNTIEGAGQVFGNGNMSIVNEVGGVFAATFADNTLNINNISFNNKGLVEAENGARLNLTSALTNLSTDANHTGGSVLTGGTYEVLDAAAGAGQIAISGAGAAGITTLAATVKLLGQSASLTSAAVSLSTSLVEIGAGGSLNLYYGSSTGTQQSFSDANAMTVDSTGDIILYGGELSGGLLTINSGGTLLSEGEFSGTLADAMVRNSIANSGHILVEGTEPAAVAPLSLFMGPIANASSGAIYIEQDATAEFSGGVTGGTVTFQNTQSLSGTHVAGRETLKIDSAIVNPTAVTAGVFSSTIAGFKVGDTIDLANFASESSYSWNGKSLVVNFTGGAQATLALSGLGAQTGFAFASDGATGTLITTKLTAKLAQDTGASATDGVTRSAALTGTGDAGATLSFSENGVSYGSTVVASTGAWSFTPTGLSDGAHTITITDSSPGGASETASVLFSLATKAPAVTAAGLAGPTNHTSETITGVATVESVPGDGLASVVVKDAHGNVVATGSLGANGAYTATVSGLADGVYDYTVVATDTAGNLAIKALAELDVATKAPTVTAQESVSGLTKHTSVTVTETATAEAIGANAVKSVTVYDGTTALGAAKLSGGVWSFVTPTLADGVHNLSTVTTDAAGNSTQTTLAAVDVATMAPTVAAHENLSGLTHATSVTITETASAEAVGSDAITLVHVYDGATLLGGARLVSGVWTFSATHLADGVHNFSTVTFDTVGNQTTATLAPVYVATQAPTVSAQESVSGLTNKTSVSFTETAVAEAVGSNAVTLVHVLDGTTLLGGARLVNGVWTYAKSGLADGVHNFSILTYDAAGNLATVKLAPVDIATQGPTVTAQESVSGVTTQRTVTVTETATAEAVASNAVASVTVFDGTTSLGAATLSSGVWSFTTGQLAFGVHNLSTVTKDLAGNATTTTLASVDVVPGGAAVLATSALTTSASPIAVGPGNETLTGGPGANTYTLLGSFGVDEITDFHAVGAGHDLFEVSKSLFADWGAFDGALSDTANGAKLSLSPSETLLFAGVSKSTLEANNAADFRFV